MVLNLDGGRDPGAPGGRPSSGSGRVLVTGASGFVGRAVCTRLLRDGFEVTACVREAGREVPAGARALAAGPLESADWDAVLPGHGTVVHLAAHVHRPREDAHTAAASHERVNRLGTVRLARAAAAAGVARFVFASSVKVCGEATGATPFDGDCAPAPSDPYAQSKLAAELALRRIEAESGMAVTIVRPPLVYGPGVGANFLSLMRAVDRGIPLPLASVRNRRSLIFVDNLADFVARCVGHAAAAGRTFTVADEGDVSTPELVRAIAAALGVRARLWPFPPALLAALATVAGRRAAADRLIGSLQVDSSAARQALGWRPPHSMGDGLAATARWYRSSPAEAGGGAR